MSLSDSYTCLLFKTKFQYSLYISFNFFQVFYGLLLQYFAVLTTKKPMNLKRLNMLVKPLMEINAEVPCYAAKCARERLLRTRTKFCEDVKDTG